MPLPFPADGITGKTWKGTAFGGWKSRTAVPRLVEQVLKGDLPIDHYVTHQFTGPARCTASSG